MSDENKVNIPEPPVTGIQQQPLAPSSITNDVDTKKTSYVEHDVDYVDFSKKG